jgi:hypothetical protein
MLYIPQKSSLVSGKSINHVKQLLIQQLMTLNSVTVVIASTEFRNDTVL